LFLGQLEGTVMREFCQVQRLQSQTSGWSLQDEDVITKPNPKKLVQVHPTIYSVMFQKLHYEDNSLRQYMDVPHPDDANILSRFVIEEKALESPTGLYISKARPNRLVAYHKDGHTCYGWVTHIYRLPECEGRVLVAVKSLRNACLGDDIEVSDGFRQSLVDLELAVVREDTNFELLDPCEIISVCAYRHLPAWSFGYHQPLVVLRQIPHDISPLLRPSSAQ
jgi:hypothetical protein